MLLRWSRPEELKYRAFGASIPPRRRDKARGRGQPASPRVLESFEQAFRGEIPLPSLDGETGRGALTPAPRISESVKSCGRNRLEQEEYG